jgi:hypothetical protein
MKVIALPADGSLAGVVIEPGEFLILKVRARAAREQLAALRDTVAAALPGVRVLVIDEQMDAYAVAEAITITADPTPAQAEELRQSWEEFAGSSRHMGTLEVRSAPAREMEKRTLHCSEVRVETTADGKKKLVGYAAVFDKTSKPLKTKSGKEFVEKIAPGAFQRALASGDDITMCIDHTGPVLARTTAGTLQLREDAKGLAFEAALPDTTAARDLVGDVEHRNIPGMSFGFDEPDDTWERGADGVPVRTLNSMMLGHISPTPYPAYDGTTVDVRSIEKAIARLPDTAASRGAHRGTEKRATMEIEDDSLVYTCRWGIESLRSAFDSCQNVMDVASRITGDLSERDQEAIDDYLDQVLNLIAKARRVKVVLQELGAVDEEDVPAAGDVDSTLRHLKLIQTMAEKQQSTAELRALLPKAAEVRAKGAATKTEKRSVVSRGGKFYVVDSDGKDLAGPFDTEAEAADEDEDED